MSDDRTSEFIQFARALSASPSNSRALTATSAAGEPTSAQHNKESSPAFNELRNFHKTAADISRDIAATSALLSELTYLVRNKSMFGDDSARINQLVVRIKTSIESLNARLDDAGATIAQQKRRLGKNSQPAQQASNLVDGLKTEFAQAASGFKEVLQQRTDNMKETEYLQRQVYGADGEKDDNPMPSLAAPPPVYQSSFGSDSLLQPPQKSFPTLDLTSGMMSAGEATGSSLPRPHGISSDIRHRRPGSSPDGIPTVSGSYSSYDRQSSGAPMTPLDIQRMEHETGADQMMQLIPDQNYLQERADAMSTVETHIVELGTIFNKLAVMVSEHNEMVQRVEDNVEDANANINLSLGALTDTLTSLKTNRMLALRVFSILVAFIIFFIVFFA